MIRRDDLEELRVLRDGLVMLAQQMGSQPIFEIAQRINHILLKTDPE